MVNFREVELHAMVGITDADNPLSLRTCLSKASNSRFVLGGMNVQTSAGFFIGEVRIFAERVMWGRALLVGFV